MISDKKIDGGRSFDWGNTSSEYTRYRDIYPPLLYERLRELGVASNKTSWLDLGTGTGILPRNLYNPMAEITGIDISKEQINFARLNAEKSGFNINYFASPAERTGLPDKSFNYITAAQCFGYFDREIMKAEIKRLLKPNGRFIKVYLDWCYDDEIAGKSISLVEKYNKKWQARSGYENMFDDLFDGRVTETFNCDIPFTRESWHGRMCACRGTLASMNKEQFDKWSGEHLKMLSSYPKEFEVSHKLYITWFEMKG
ncbi:MAG: methyltransferase domain-containing protein [Eubacterium sp.]|nr:methyltransferase domain-containing protein [Eubacterium sp.]